MIKKYIFPIIMLFLIIFSSRIISAQENIYGIYEVQDDNTLIKEVIIEEDILKIVIDNENVIKEETEDGTHSKVLDFRNLIVNHDTLYSLVDDENQGDSDKTLNNQYLDINFANGASFPTFCIDIVNPTYKIIDDIFIVKYRNDRVWEFSIESKGLLVDENGVKYEIRGE